MAKKPWRCKTMTRRQARASACEGKRSFPTYAEADRNARTVNRLGHRQRTRPYRCDFCFLYHLGRPHRGETLRDLLRRESRERAEKSDGISDT